MINVINGKWMANMEYLHEITDELEERAPTEMDFPRNRFPHKFYPKYKY